MAAELVTWSAPETVVVFHSGRDGAQGRQEPLVLWLSQQRRNLQRRCSHQNPERLQSSGNHVTRDTQIPCHAACGAQ